MKRSNHAKLPKKAYLLISVAALVMSWANMGHAMGKEITIHIQNVTSGVILTPPLVAITKRPVTPFFKVGEPASEGLAKLAEGGDRSDLISDIETYRRAKVADPSVYSNPILPGEIVSVTLTNVKPSDYLHFGSMLLPTNDAFAGLTNIPVIKLLKFHKGVKAYDAGSELNEETCITIPGPQCGGEGFNEEDGEGIVHPHAGIHGEGELSVKSYNWGNPVAVIKAEYVKKGK